MSTILAALEELHVQLEARAHYLSQSLAASTDDKIRVEQERDELLKRAVAAEERALLSTDALKTQRLAFDGHELAAKTALAELQNSRSRVMELEEAIVKLKEEVQSLQEAGAELSTRFDEIEGQNCDLRAWAMDLEERLGVAELERDAGRRLARELEENRARLEELLGVSEKAAAEASLAAMAAIKETEVISPDELATHFYLFPENVSSDGGNDDHVGRGEKTSNVVAGGSSGYHFLLLIVVAVKNRGIFSRL